jgi:hypothetical protein
MSRPRWRKCLPSQTFLEVYRLAGEIPLVIINASLKHQGSTNAA